MKVAKKEMRLSSGHPTLLAQPDPIPGIYAPVVLSERMNLVDGYRRFFLQKEDEIEAITMPAEPIFRTALVLNLHTRRWDEIDSLLWTRWARSLGEDSNSIPAGSFPAELLDAPESILSYLARREISIRQAILIRRLPVQHHNFFLRLFGLELQLNANESTSLLEYTYDLMNQRKLKSPEDLLRSGPLSNILADGRLSLKGKGDALLKAMRELRYPMYQERSSEFSDGWKQLDVGDGIRVGRELFLQRGVLEVTIAATSRKQFQERVKRLGDTLNSAGWSKVWKG